MLRPVCLFALFTACLTSTVLAQEQTSTVIGIIVDSENQPLSDVVVFLDEGPVSLDGSSESATTGAVGAFQLEGVTAGPHFLNLRKAGFAPRTYELVFVANEGRRDIGVVVLEEGPDPTVTIEGRVTDEISGQPVGNAVVKLNGNMVALTDGDGVFSLSEVPIAWGSNEFEVGRFSFLPMTSEFWVGDPDEILDFSAVLEPAPIDVDAVVASVEARPLVARRLQPFYERMERGGGQFVTREEIDARDPPVVTDILRGVTGVRVRNGQYGLEVWFSRAIAVQCRAPIIYLNGMFVGGGPNDYLNVNDLVNPEQVEGIELYGGVARVPNEFSRPGSDCGVVVLWTR